MPKKKNKLTSYGHYPLVKAEHDYQESGLIRYRVTTINWTFATVKGEVDFFRVHKNVYSWTLPYLIDWIRRSTEVAEDIITIEEEKC